MNFKTETVKLSEIVEMPIQTGFQVRGKVEHDPEGNYKLIQVKNVSRITHQVISSGLERITIPEEKNKFMDKYLLGKDDVIYLSKLNPGAFRYEAPEKAIVPMAHFYLLRPKEKGVNPDYLCWALNQDFMKPFLAKSLKGTTLPFISKSDLAEFEVPIPALDIQKKIVVISSLRIKEKELNQKIEEKKDILINEILERYL